MTPMRWGAGMANEDKPAHDSRPVWSEGLPAQTGSAEKRGTIASSGLNAAAPAQPGPAHPASSDANANNLAMVLDIPVQLSVELGRTKMPIKQILQLKVGSVVELDRAAGEPVDVLVNGYLVAQGEVVVVNGQFGIRLTDVVTASERLKRIGKT